MSVRDRYEAAVNKLAAQEITAVLDTTAGSAGDAWCDHTTSQDDRVTVAHEYGAQWSGGGLRVRDLFRARDWLPVSSLYFAHPRSDLSVAEAVVAAFRGQGFAVEWDGTADSSVIVHLTA